MTVDFKTYAEAHGKCRPPHRRGPEPRAERRGPSDGGGADDRGRSQRRGSRDLMFVTEPETPLYAI